VLEQLALALHRDVLAGGHAERPGQETGDPGQQDEARVAGRGSGHAHDQRQVADKAVADPEDHRPERPGPAASVPAFALDDLRGAPRLPRECKAVGFRCCRSGSAGRA
jgi:hypothetical protein